MLAHIEVVLFHGNQMFRYLWLHSAASVPSRHTHAHNIVTMKVLSFICVLCFVPVRRENTSPRLTPTRVHIPNGARKLLSNSGSISLALYTKIMPFVTPLFVYA